MHILLDYRPALRQRSGAGEFIHQLALALVAAVTNTDARDSSHPPHSIGLFSSSWKDRLDPRGFEGIHTRDRRIPVTLLNLAWHRLAWPPVESLVGHPVDVVHSPHPLLTPARGAAQVVTIHDLDFLDHPERTRAEIRRDYPDLVADHARRADRVVVPSRFTADLVTSRLGVPAERVALCVPGAPAWSPRLHTSDGYVLFIGTLEPRKNLRGLLTAYEILLRRNGAVPDLVVAGAATADSSADLDRIRRPPLTGHVRYVGYVQDAGRRALYEGARVLVIPSFNEGFGLPALEAMTLGVPVVAADRGSLPEILGEAGLTADPDDHEGFANALDSVIRDDDLADSLASRGVARASGFTWHACARAALAAYIGARAQRQGLT